MVHQSEKAEAAGWRDDVGTMVVALLVLGVLAAALKWGELGGEFYRKVVPFYDSLSYQEGFAGSAARSETTGAWRAMADTWRESGNNVVLYKFFGAAFGQVVPADRAGLYFYLCGVYAIGAVGLGLVVWRVVGARWAGVVAVTAWLSAQPFQIAREGVVDQRMDLASSSFYLVLGAASLVWSRAPTWGKAGGVGLVLALAILHRPVMAVSAAGVVGLFVLRAVLRHGWRSRTWWRDARWIAAPGLVLALPWLLTHFGELYHYYAIANVDVGSAASFGDALAYNWGYFARAMGGTYGWILLGGVGALAFTRKLDGGDVCVVVMATLLPLALLIASRSIGNHFVCQLPLGVPALLLGCARWREERGWERGPAAAFAAVGLVCVLVNSIRSVAAQVEAESPQVRRASEAVVQRIVERKPGPRLATFHNHPVNVVALQIMARERGVKMEIGTVAYHPHHFGIPNERAATISQDELEKALAGTIEQMRRADDFLLLPTREAEPRLLGQPYSHRVIPTIRTLIEADASFVWQEKLGPIDGIEFDLFAIRR